MKKAITLLLAALALLTLSGCGSLFERDYYYETPYSGDMEPRSDQATEVRNYSMLKTVLTSMIVSHMEAGELRFINYNGSPSEDLAAACFEIKSEHPLGAYAVESLSYDTSYVVSYYMANIYISYKRTAEELKSIVYATDTADFDRNLAEAVHSFSPKLIIRCYDAAVDENYVRTFLKRHYYDDPVTLVMEPTAAVTGYPADGVNRILDIRFQYGLSAQRQGPMSLALSGKLTEAVGSMTETEPAALALECAAFLSDRCAGDIVEGAYTGTAYGAMVEGRADSKGYALAYRALCTALGLDCTVVEGSFGAMGGEPHFWNIIALGGNYYHVDVSAFAADPAAAFLRSDDAIWGAYLWDTAAYPACGGPLSYAEVAGIPDDDEEPGQDGPADREPGETDPPAPTEEPVETEPPAETEPPTPTEPPAESPAPTPGEEEPEPTEPPVEKNLDKSIGCAIIHFT